MRELTGVQVPGWRGLSEKPASYEQDSRLDPAEFLISIVIQGGTS